MIDQENVVRNGQRVTPIPPLHSEWLTSQENTQRGKQSIHNEVMKRLAVERDKGEKRDDISSKE